MNWNVKALWEKARKDDVKAFRWPPTWVNTGLLIVIFGLMLGIAWTWLSYVSSPIGALIATGVFGTVSGYLYVTSSGKSRADEQRKRIKLIFDILWNIWTFIGIALLIQSALHIEAAKVASADAAGPKKDLVSLSLPYPAFFSMVATFGLVVTLMRAVIAVCDYIWEAPKPKNKKQRPLPTRPLPKRHRSKRPLSAPRR